MNHELADDFLKTTVLATAFFLFGILISLAVKK